MEVKKSPEADLEKEKSGFTLMGLLIAMCVLFIAFEWSQHELKIVDKTDIPTIDEGDEEVAPISDQNTPPPPPPPAPEPQVEITTPEYNKKEDAVTQKIEINSEDTGQEIETKQVISQTTEVEEEEVDKTIYTRVEKKAEFPGGKAALAAFLQKNLQYPKAALETGTQGNVIVKFTVNADGSIQDVEVTRSIDPALDKEAIRVVKMMPKWTPAMNQNKKVRSKFSQPIVFKIG